MAEMITMPKLGFDMAEGTLVRWVKSEGEPFKKGEVLAEIETDKATVEVEAQYDAVLLKHLLEEGTIVPIGTPIAAAGDEGETFDPEMLPEKPEGKTAEKEPDETPESEGKPQPEKTAEPTADEQFPGGKKASPLARRLADEKDLNLRATNDNYEAFKDAEYIIISTPSLETERVPLSRLREAIGRRMTASKRDLPHFYLTIDLDAGPLTELRSDLNRVMPEGIKLSVNDFLVRAAALTMLEFPNLNASLEEDAIVRHGEVNIGVAVAVEDGLMTIVNRNTDQKPLRTISTEITQAVDRAREGKVRPEDVEGSTFTISNLGMYDIDSFVAIINPPEAAILAVGSIHEVPVIRDGQVVPAKRMKVTLSADHRVTDGAEAARWLQVFRSYVEEPLRLVA